MSALASVISLRVHPENPNHHLWNNHGTWFLHYTVHPTPFTKERIRCSLRTKDLAVARVRRDALFATFATRSHQRPGTLPRKAFAA